MITLAELLQECHQLLGDENVLPGIAFSTLQVQSWINEGIMDLSPYFPMQVKVNLGVQAGKQVYILPANYMSVVSVEFPAGMTPRRYLMRRSIVDRRFWVEGGYYDVVNRNASSGGSFGSELVVSEKAKGDEGLVVEILSEHAALSAPNDVCPMARRVTSLIPLFVRWRAWQELAMSQGMMPDLVKPMGLTYEQSAALAQEAYEAARAHQLQVVSESVVMRWRLDRFDPLV